MIGENADYIAAGLIRCDCCGLYTANATRLDDPQNKLSITACEACIEYALMRVGAPTEGGRSE